MRRAPPPPPTADPARPRPPAGPRHRPARGLFGDAPAALGRHHDPPADHRHRAAQQGGLRLPPVLAHRRGTVDRIQYELVSTIAIFGIGIKADGNLDTTQLGYKDYVGDDVAAITNAAHDKGVRVVPTFQLFDSGSLTKMRTFLASTTAQTRFIGQALDVMATRQADGANLDFEPMLNADAASYVAFVAKFRTAMKARFPTAQLVNATSAGAGKDLIAGLVPLVDRQMIMTYGYRERGPRRWPAPWLRWTTRRAPSTQHIQLHPALRARQHAPPGRALLRLRLAGHLEHARMRPSRSTRRHTGPSRASRTPARATSSPPIPRSIRQYDAVKAAASTRTGTRPRRRGARSTSRTNGASPTSTTSR